MKIDIESIRQLLDLKDRDITPAQRAYINQLIESKFNPPAVIPMDGLSREKDFSMTFTEPTIPTGFPPMPFQLKAGRSYLTRGGAVRGPMRSSPWLGPGRAFSDGIGVYLANGHIAGGMGMHLQDLVSLAPDEEPATISEKETVGAYPPPESEWPEKIEAPDGCEWQREPMAGKAIPGERYIALADGGDGKLIWYGETGKTIRAWTSLVVFRAVPAPVVVNESPVSDDQDGLRGENEGQDFFGEIRHDPSLALYRPEDSAGNPVTDPEESRAKAELKEGWLWYGRKKVERENSDATSPDIACWQSTGNWGYGDMSGEQKGVIYALRAGSEIARANGLNSPESPHLAPDGWLLYGRKLLTAYPRTQAEQADLMVWNGTWQMWFDGGSGVGNGNIYCIRAGSDLAQANGLEPDQLWDGPPYQDAGKWWRNLGPKAVIREGDEVITNPGRHWTPSIISIGGTVHNCGLVSARRLVTEPGEVMPDILDVAKKALEVGLLAAAECKLNATYHIRIMREAIAAIEALTGRAKG